MRSLLASVALCLFCVSPALAADLPSTQEPAVSQPEQPAGSTCAGPGEAKCRIDLPTGISMAYWETGPVDGPVIIFLHGLTDSARSWAPTMAWLAKNYPKYHLIALDQRGHGESSMPKGASCPAEPKNCFAPLHFASDLRAFMNAKGIEKATLAGHSMGSIVAQQAALDMPQRVENIILVATSNASKGNVVLQDYVLKEPVLGAWKKGLEAKGITTPEAVWNATPRDADPKAEEWIAANWDVDMFADQAFVSAIVPETAGVKMGTWIGASEALLEVDNTTRLASLTVPTLVLWGTQDAIFYKTPDQDGMIAALKASKAKWFWKQYGKAPLPASGVQDADIGHNIQWEVPAAVGDDIAAFLATGQPSDSNYSMVKDGAGWKLDTGVGATIVKSQ